MRNVPFRLAATSVAGVAALGGLALAAQDKYSVQVPGGLSLAECRGYEDWQAVSVSQAEGRLNLIVANPAMVNAYKAGTPGDGKAFPDGSKTVKIHYRPKDNGLAASPAKIPEGLMGLGCMVKDSRRFADGGGWGYAQFDYDAASQSFKPNTTAQGQNARCGVACHNQARATDFVFTAYQRR